MKIENLSFFDKLLTLNFYKKKFFQSLFKICITHKSGKEIYDVNNIEVIANKGIVNDRYFNEDNDELNNIWNKSWIYVCHSSNLKENRKK